MATDARNYFEQRLLDAQEDTNYAAALSRYTELDNASQRAHQVAQEAGQRRKQVLLKNESSWMNQLGLEEDGLAGQAVNIGAAAISGLSSNVVGALAGLPANAGAANELVGITNQEAEAYAAAKRGTATPEQNALLDREIPSKGGPVDIYRQLTIGGNSVRARLANAEQLNQSAKGINDFFDIGGIVNRTGQEDLTTDLKNTFQDNWNKVTSGSATDKASGIANLLGGAISAGVSNKDGLAAFLAENIPQMAIGLLGSGGRAAQLMSNVGYGFDTFQDGVQEYQKANGRMPAGEDLGKIIQWSAAAAGAEQAGDLLSIRGFQDMLGKGAAKAASGAATKQGVAATAARIGSGAASGFGSEAATEGFQTFAENEAQFKDTSAEDLYVAGSVGGLVGGAMRGGLSTVQEGARVLGDAQVKGAQLVAERQAKTEDVEAAIKSNDPSKFTNVNSKDYNPGTAVDVLYKAVQANKDDAAIQAGNLEKANSVLATAQERLTSIDERIAAVKDADNTRSKLEGEITRLQEAAAQAAPEDAEIAQMRVEVAQDSLDQLNDDVKRIKNLEYQSKSLKDSIEKGTKIANAFTSTEVDQLTAEQISNPTSGQEVDRVINLSMAAPDKVSTKALEALSSNANATTEQKAYVQAAADARKATEAAASIDSVNTDVLYGNTKTNKTGIQQYRRQIGTALAGNQLNTANAALARMEVFAANHTSKAELAQQVFDETVAAGTNDAVAIAPNAQGQWQRVPAGITPPKGAMTIHRGSNQSGLIDAVRMEAEAVKASLAEMQAAVAAKASTPSPTPTAPAATQATPARSAATASAPVQESKETTPAPTEAVAQSPLSSDKGKDGGVANQAQVATPSSETESQAVTSNKQLDKETEGGLTVFANAKQKVANLGQEFKNLNLVSQFFTQRTSKANDASKQPLVSIKDFHTALQKREVTVGEFLADPELTTEQQDAVKHFLKFATANYDTIQANLTLPRDVFGYQDMVRFLVNEDGSVDQNVKTAIAAAAYTWIAENGNKPAYNTIEDVRDMLGLGDYDFVSSELQGVLAQAGTNERNIIASMGQRAVAALGLQVSKDAPANLRSTLEISLGAQAWKLLDNLGFFERTVVPGSVVQAGVSKSKRDNYDAKAAFNFSAVKKNEEGVIPQIKEIIDAQKGTSGVLNKLFGVDSSLVAPTTDPVKKVQKFTQGTEQPVPTKMQDVIRHENSVPNYLRQDTWGILQAMDTEAIRDIAGYNRVDLNTLHETQRAGVQAKNDGLDYQIANAQDFFATHDPDAPMYFEHSVWKQQRVGISTNMVNPQSSKFHRFLVSRPEWETTVRTGDKAMMDSLKMRIGEGLKIKTDKQDNTKSMAMIEAKLQDPKIQAAATAITETMIRGEEMTAARQKAIVEGVQAGKMQMHSLDALIALAYMQDAMAKNSKEFKVKIMGEIDGVTNGPMLSHLLMGAAQNPEALYEMLARGGFYPMESDVSNYNVWRGQAGNQDLYETTISHVLDRMNVPDDIRAAFYQMVGALSDEETSKITGEGRDIIKTPLTAMVFGSSLDGAIDSMFDKFVGTIYEKMADSANDPSVTTANMKAINALLSFGNSTELFTKKTDLLETKLTRGQTEALRKAFDKIIGDAVKDTMDVDFAIFMNARKTVNDGAQAAFRLYDAARKGITEKFINDKMESGEIAFRETKTGKQPIHDLTPAMKEELGALLLPVTPVQATLMSLDSEQKDAGLAVAKSGRQFSRQPQYQGEAHFGTATSTGTKSLKLAAYEFSLSSPGVAMMVMSVHSTDSAISHNAVMGFGTPTQVLNVHDAHGSGLEHFTRTANNLNRATWDAMLRYSPAREMFNTLTRTVEGMQGLLKNPEYAAAIQPYLKDALSLGTKKSPKTLTQVVAELDTEATAADKVKLETLSQMWAVDQYALEGGEYQVTNEDRKQASNALSKVKSGLTSELSQSITDVIDAARTRKEAKAVEADPEFQEEIQPAPAAAIAKVVTPVTGASLASQVAPASVQEKLNVGTPIQEAVEALSEREQAQVVQALGDAQNKLPQTAFSPWGEMGTSNINHDSVLVEALAANPVMGKDQVLELVRDSITRSTAPRNLREFNAKLYQLLKKSAPDNLEVKYVTPTTSANEVMGKGASKSRGWYMSQGDSNQIYILSPDHKYSGVTAELLLHELTHSVLAGLIETELANKAADPTYTSEALDLINNLDDLRKTAESFMNADQKAQYAPAIANVHEFVSWGMTNQEFQINVLSKIEGKAPNNSLIQGMKAFLKNVVGILFRSSTKTEQQQLSNGLAVLVANTSGLFYAASQKKTSADIVLNQQAVDPLVSAENMTLEQLYEAIADTNPANQPSQEFNTHLMSLLNGMVSKIHDPMGTVKEVARANQALSAYDVYTKALDEGKLPFASMALHSGFKVNNQEAFVMEQVEAVVSAALETNETQTTAAYSELRRVYAKARQLIKPKDLLPTGVTEAIATQQQLNEAQSLWDAVFQADAGRNGKSNYIAKFVALSLAHEGFASKLGFDATRTKRDPDNLWDRAMVLFDGLLNWVLGKLTKTEGLVTADAFIQQLANQLVDIEAKRRVKATSSFDTLMQGIEDKLDKLGTTAQKQVMKVAKSKAFMGNKNGYLKAAGLAVSLVAAPERVNGILDGINAVRDKFLEERQGILASIITEMRGLEGAKDVFLKLLLGTKNIETKRANLTAEVSKAVLESFAKKVLTKQELQAVTNVFLRNDLGVLVDKFSMQEIQQLISDPTYREAEIAKLETAMAGTKYENAMRNQTSALGYLLATGVSKRHNLMLNAHNIANMGGSRYLGRVDADEAIRLEPVIDQLASLYAIRYSSVSELKLAKDVFAAELARTDKGNGIETILKIHKELQRDSKERLFDNNEALVFKGYLPEITNPYITFKVATAQEGKELERLGFVKGKQVGNDPAEANPEAKYIYTQRDGGMQRYLSSMVSFTGNQRKGASNQKDNTIEVQQIFNRKDALTINLDKGLVDPSTVQESFMVPVLNSAGQVVNYRYMMASVTRDNLLERDNRFEHLLGTMAGNTFDKIASPEQNRTVMTALHEQYQQEKNSGAARFQEISATSADPEFREIWNMLPEQTKQDIESIWGTKGLYVRNDMLDLVFGYRKYSLANVWDKENRAFYEEALVWAVEGALYGWAIGTGRNPDEWVARAKQFVRNGEDMWQEIVKETKSNIVIRTITVLVGNITSNFSVLKWYGVPVKDMIHHHRVAIKAAQDHQRDSARLTRVQLMLDTGALEGNDRADLQNEVTRLKDALARNPVNELIEVGLMPTIVEDLSSSEDIYSYKSQLARKVDSMTEWVNPSVKKGLEYIYIGQKTPLYQGLNRATQLSDFVARYTLYNHLVGKKGMSKEEAVTRASDAFVNYDIPTHRSIQFLNDMGVLPFTKYYLRIQRVLLQLMAEKPAQGILMLLMSDFLGGIETIHQSSMFGRLGNNPFTLGALNYPSTLDDLATIKAAMSLK